MYIWVILAFFITMLYSYNLAFRADIREITVSPRAQSVASKVVIQHEAASRWVRDHSLGGDSLGTPVPPGNNMNDFEAQRGDRAREIGTGEMKAYLPYGYQADYGPKYRSFLYCLDKRNMRSLAVSCNDEFMVAYLITYGCVAQKWISMTTGKPNKDLEFGISEAKKLGAEMGYTEDFSGLPFEAKIARLSIQPYAATSYVEGEDGNVVYTGYNDLGENSEWGNRDDYYEGRYIGNYYIMRGRAEPSPIPRYISDSEEEREGFGKICGKNRSCPFCLAYITSFE